MTKSAIIESERVLWNGRFPLSRVAANLVEDDGTRRSLDFEVYRHGPAAAALPYDAERGCVLLVRQFRLGALLANGARDVLEAPAGMLDGDAPDACARRELLEETGVKAEALEVAFDFLPSPGGSSEIIHCFFVPYRARTRPARRRPACPQAPPGRPSPRSPEARRDGTGAPTARSRARRRR